MGRPGFLKVVLSQVWSKHEGWAIQTEQTRLASQAEDEGRTPLISSASAGSGGRGWERLVLSHRLYGPAVLKAQGLGMGAMGTGGREVGVQDCP